MKVHGIMKSLEDVEVVIDELRKRRIPGVMGLAPFRQEYYRGQVSNSWNLIPSIARNLKSAAEVEHYEQVIMELFKKEMEEKGKMENVFLHQTPIQYQNDWAWLGQAQHYGVPTRMMDWSLKWEVALYFAVDNPLHDNTEGQFWILYVPGRDIRIDGGEGPQYYEHRVSEVNETIFLNPSFFWDENHEKGTAEVRRARQHGKFSMQSYDKCILRLEEQDEFAHDYSCSTRGMILEKFIVPAAFKAQIRLELVAKGFYGDYLYANDDAEINGIRDDCKNLLPTSKP